MQSTQIMFSANIQNLINSGVLEVTDIMCPECKKPMLRHVTPPDKPKGLATCPDCSRDELGDLISHGITTTDTLAERSLRHNSWQAVKNKSIYSGNPDKVFAKRFDNFKADTDELKQIGNQSYKLAEQLLKAPLHVMLSGSTGLGKTHLAIAMLNKVINSGNPNTKGIFINFAEYIDLKRIASFDETEDAKQAVRRTDYLIKVADYVVLDDIGAERGDINSNKQATDYEASLLLKIINARDGKALIMTTNLSSGQLMKKYDQRTYSRIVEDIHGIQFTGADYRLRN